MAMTSKPMPDIKRHFIGKYVVLRTESGNLHAGIVSARDGIEVLLIDSRRIWYWNGAGSISQLAATGIGSSKHCKLSVVSDEILLLGVSEIISCKPEAERSIREAKEWAGL